MPTETYYDNQTNTYKTRKTSTGDDVADAQATEKFTNFRAPKAGAKPEQDKSDKEPPKGTIQHAIWEKRQKAKAEGQRKALSE